MPALDGLRGVAILMVILGHVGSGWTAAGAIFRDASSLPDTFELPPWLWSMAEFGIFGVQLFFVVSAFTLTARAPPIGSDLRGYAVRRLVRVAPGYWLAGIGYTLVAGLAPRMWAPNGVTTGDLAIAAGFASIWQGGASFAVVPGGWSVSAEVAFYAALPLVLRFVDGRIGRALGLLAATMTGAELWFLHLERNGEWDFLAYCNPIEQAPVFLCGVTGALIAARPGLPDMPSAAFAAMCGALITLPNWHSALLPTHLQFAILISVAVTLYSAHPPSLLRRGFMVRIGRVSYSMYLVHFAVLPASLTVAEKLFPRSDWMTMLAHYAMTATASFAIACVTFKYIETPPIAWATRRRSWRGRDHPARGDG